MLISWTPTSWLLVHGVLGRREEYRVYLSFRRSSLSIVFCNQYYYTRLENRRKCLAKSNNQNTYWGIDETNAFLPNHFKPQNVTNCIFYNHFQTRNTYLTLKGNLPTENWSNTPFAFKWQLSQLNIFREWKLLVNSKRGQTSQYEPPKYMFYVEPQNCRLSVSAAIPLQ